MVPPEQGIPQKIDRQLVECGWLAQRHRDMNIAAGLGVAIREFPLTTGPADDMLYADGAAMGVIEAKPQGDTLGALNETQSAK